MNHGGLRAADEKELRAILSVCDALVGGYGRTTLCQALRGSRAKKILETGAAKARGYGYFAKVPESEVLARIDGLIARRVLRLEHNDGYPILGYTETGLKLAVQYTAEEWLEFVRSHVELVANGAPLTLPFLMSVLPNRNLDTINSLLRLVTKEVNPTWLPLLRAWHQVETRRIRGQLLPIIERLECDALGPGGGTTG